MVDKQSDVYRESYYPIKIGQGIYTSELASNIPDGFSAQAFNFIATGDSLENRPGFRRSAVTWNDEVPTRAVDDAFLITRNASNSEFVWSSHVSGVSKMHFVRQYSPGASGLNYTEVTMPQQVRGITGYHGYIYFVMSDANKIYVVSGIDWATGVVSYTSIPSATTIPNSTGLVAFKDRLWTLYLERIYFTEIATLGANGPETWVATNYISVDAGMGKCDIKKIVPLSNKLLIFTSAGAFTLLVEGEPSSWILRILDSESQSTSRNCAFEAKGIVYYVNTQGVWATNGQSVAKLSGVIEDQFFLAKGVRHHTIHPYEDGMLLSIDKVNSIAQYDAPNCRLFYSKLDPVGWTDWNIDNGDKTANAFGGNRIVEVHSVSAKVSTQMNPEPSVYMVVSVSDSTEASPQSSRVQLVVVDGGENQLVTRTGDLVTAPISCVLKTKYMDGGNPYRLKTNKECKLEIFTSDTMHDVHTSWDIDSTVGAATTVRDKNTREFTVGIASNLIRIPTDFKFRRCALTLAARLQSNTSQFKIKDVMITLAEDRSETEVVR